MPAAYSTGAIRHADPLPALFCLHGPRRLRGVRYPSPPIILTMSRAVADVAGAATVTLTGTVDRAGRRRPGQRDDAAIPDPAPGRRKQGCVAGRRRSRPSRPARTSASPAARRGRCSPSAAWRRRPRSPGRRQVSKSAPAQVAGKFMVAHADNFETGTSQFFYQVFDEQGGVTDSRCRSCPARWRRECRSSSMGRWQPTAPASIRTASPSCPSPTQRGDGHHQLPGDPDQVSDQWRGNRGQPMGLQRRSVHARVAEHRGLRRPAHQERQGILQGGLLRPATLSAARPANNGSGGFLLANVAAPPCSNYGAIGTAAENAATNCADIHRPGQSAGAYTACSTCSTACPAAAGRAWPT